MSDDVIMTDEEMRFITIAVMFITLFVTIVGSAIYQTIRERRNRQQDKSEREELAKTVKKDTTDLASEVKKEAHVIAERVDTQTTMVVQAVEKEVAKLETVIKETVAETKGDTQP